MDDDYRNVQRFYASVIYKFDSHFLGNISQAQLPGSVIANFADVIDTVHIFVSLANLLDGCNGRWHEFDKLVNLLY